MTPRSWTLQCASQRVVKLSDVKMNTVCMSLVALKETIRLNPLIGEMHTAESEFCNFTTDYFGEIETELEHILVCLRGPSWG